MQEFEIKGKTTITAEVKAQVDNSPLVLPPPEDYKDTMQPFGDALKGATDNLSISSSVIKELGAIIPELSTNFHTLNDIINKTNQSLVNTPINNKPEEKSENTQQLLALPMPEGYTPEPFQPLVDVVDESTDKFKGNNAILKEFGDVMPVLLKNLIAMNDAVSKTSKNLPAISHGNKPAISKDAKQQMIDNINRQNFMQLLNTGGNAVQSVANGNVVGGIVGGVNTAASAANNVSKLVAMEGMAGLAKGLIAGGVAAAAGALVIKGADTLATKFLEEAPTIYGTGKAFSSTNDNDAMRSYQKINFFNKGTGLDIGEFQNIAQLLRKQGVGNNVNDKETYVGDIARTTSRWAYATGGDAAQYAELAGVMSRYGGSKNVSEDFNKLVTAGYASGMQDTQIPEFLSAIKKVMEDGIARGFERSATDVADTLLMFSKMSGNNAFWQGEQGAKMLNQMNSSITQATSLSKTEDLLVYRAFENAYSYTDKTGKKIDKKREALTDANGNSTYIDGGGYINTMQLIEKGINAENYDELMDSLTSAYGDNTQAKIEALRKMTGLNYTGAARLFNIDKNASEDDKKTEIKEIMSSPDNMNKETRYQEAMNEIKAAVVRIGSGAAELKIKSMELVSNNVQRIADKVAPGIVDTSSGFGFDPVAAGLAKEIGENVPGDTPSKTDWLDVKSIGYKDYASINEFVRAGEFGEWIKQLADGDEEQANNFLSTVFNGLNNKNDRVERLGEMVQFVTDDGRVNLQERSKISTEDGNESIKGILLQLYNLFKEGGLEVTYNVP